MSAEVAGRYTNGRRMAAQGPSHGPYFVSSCCAHLFYWPQEFIFRTFAVGNYDMLRHLPATIREQQVGIRNVEGAGSKRTTVAACSSGGRRMELPSMQNLMWQSCVFGMQCGCSPWQPKHGPIEQHLAADMPSISFTTPPSPRH